MTEIPDHLLYIVRESAREHRSRSRQRLGLLLAIRSKDHRDVIDVRAESVRANELCTIVCCDSIDERAAA